MKSLDEMTVTEIKATMAEQFMQRDHAEAQKAQANEALKTLSNLLQLRMKEESDKAKTAAENKKQPDPAPAPDKEETASN